MNNDNDIKLVEVLSRHYTETFDLLKQVVARRDRLFVYILLVIFAVLLYMSSPTLLSDWVNSFFNKQVAGNTTTSIAPLIDVSVIGVVLLLGLLALSHTYFQTVLHVERQYDYVYQLEHELSKHFNDKAFIREGKHYRTYKRKFSMWTKVIFWYLFPILYLLFIAFWLRFLVITTQTPPGYKLVDAAITVSILVSLALYLLAIIKHK
ncbi:MAG: hypothetical protein ABI904_10575 [Chloroflexota bacterium]